jgi:hypothetical protein
MISAMNWTSTTVPMWQIDCENYRKVGGPFQLRDVTTAEHEAFIKLFCARYDHEVKLTGTTATFSAIASKAQKKPLQRRKSTGKGVDGPSEK